MVGGKKFEEAIAYTRIFLVDYRVAGGIQEHAGFDEAGERQNVSVELQSIGHREGVRMAGYGDHVLGAKDGGLFEDFAANFGEGEPVGCGIETFQTSCILNRLQGYAADTRLLQRVIDDFSDFAVVQAFAKGHYQGGRDFIFVQPLDGAFANAAQVAATQIEQRFPFEGVELQVNLEVLNFGEALYEIVILGDFQAVGVHHQMAYRPGLSHFDDGEKIGMKSGFAARKLHHVGMPLVPHHGVQHLFDQGERAMFGAFRAAARVAHWATKIARVGDLHERKAGMLLVIGAQAAVVGAAPLYRCVVYQWHFRLFDEHLAAPPVIVNVIGYQYTLSSILGTALEEENLVVLENDLAFQFTKALRTDRQRHIVKSILQHAFGHFGPLFILKKS